MLAFLRKIRKSLINSGAITKYLFYAIGEIILVVVGIIIALQLNNWNESRKFSKIEKEYLVALKDEFEENLNILKENKETNQRVMQGMRNMLSITGPTPPSTSELQYKTYHIQFMKEIPNYEPTEAVMNDLISSGNLSKLSNTALRRSISKSQAYLNRLNRQEIAIRDARLEIIKLNNQKGLLRPITAANLNIEESKFKISPIIVLSNPQYENQLTFCLAYSGGLKQIYVKKEEILMKIQDLIIQQLKDDI